ncbi:8-oxo-dGTP diphosphatase [Nitrospirillum amazonense]|uniref:8-oxo-dGTP diphosphatase n=1 Tax=Nitrospirillum amazonense TaxID=28077 RepID=A0A560K9M4_9PROT|nr:NUDIX domain-containing protein [Nitrospirillum amazonense]TWB77360.1 8-oxo-dGTP diphosphatase [Nitrospirillum amazonense]
MTQSLASAAAGVPKVGIGVLIQREGRILLGRRRNSHGDGSYSWCGGHLEYGETFEECAIREVKEECGLVVRRLRFLCLHNILAYDKHYVDIQFIAEEVEPGEPQVLEPHKIADWGWYGFDALPRPLFRPVELALDAWAAQRSYTPLAAPLAR